MINKYIKPILINPFFSYKNINFLPQDIIANFDKRILIFCFIILYNLPLFISFPVSAQIPAANTESIEVPELEVPVYSNLKDTHISIPLVVNGDAFCSIVTPSIYKQDAEKLQEAIEKRTGVKLPIILDTDHSASIPLSGNFIILGNRSTSQISRELYDHHYSLMDLKYPGKNGYSVRSLHNPYGNEFSAILIGGSDVAGVSLGTAAFISELSQPAVNNDLRIGWTMLTQLGEGIEIPTDIKDFETWEASKGYGSIGYFGRNSISKRMAAYYMTGDPFHAREVIRLSFPDAQAHREIDEIDGERIENKNDPLAGPYHYNATKTILYWDLIEESPVFTDAERLKVTNAFARRIDHEGTTPFDKTTYKLNTVPSAVGSRHGQWSALSLYTLGRYFNKYYPSPMWAQAERAGQIAFASLHNHAWVTGEGDQLNWYCTGIAPILTYMVLTGDREPIENGVLQRLLQGQEVIITGRTPEWALNSAALDFLNKATYLTGDGRWITYRQRTGIDTDIFRLGQSFWPEEHIKPVEPVDLVNRWLVNFLPEPMWKSRGNNFAHDQSFTNMSYRNASDSSGDYILIDGYNGAYSNPYHTYTILELRLNGSTLLKGYNNQILSSADGMVEPKVAMDGAIIHHEVVGQVAVAVGEVPNLPFVNWRRSLALRTRQYALIADDITFRPEDKSRQSEMQTRVETFWEVPGAQWIAEHNYLKINPAEVNPEADFELHTSELMDVRPGRITTMVWQGNPGNSRKRTFFHLLGQEATTGNERLINLQLEDNAAILRLPEAALAVSGQYRGVQGELVLLGENSLYGHALRSAALGTTFFTSDFPVEVDWDFEKGTLSVINTKAVRLTLALSSPEIYMNGKKMTGRKEKNLYSFNLAAGRHELSGAKPSSKARKFLSVELRELLKLAQQRRAQQLEQYALQTKTPPPVFTPVMQGDLGGMPIESIIIPAPEGQNDFIVTATGNKIIIINSEGKEVNRMTTPGDVRVLHWWAGSGLLLAGCSDELVIAYDEQGHKKWEFVSVMDPAVYEAGKPYWFKSAYPGISGLNSGNFDDGKSRAFIGSATTLEVLDETGHLVKRLPVFWGPGRQFLMVDAADGSKNMLIGRWPNGRATMAIVNSKEMRVVDSGYAGVPEGHTFINGWGAMNRFDNFLTDLDNDGNKEIVSAINGVWNRVTIYSEGGTPLYNAQFGPGLKEPRANIRMMDVGDLDGDGKQEIVVGLSSGFVNVLDAQTRKIWAKQLSSPPTVVKVIHQDEKSWIFVGSEDGTVVAMDNHGDILKKGKMNGKPIDINVLKTSNEPLVVVLTDEGIFSGFRFD